MNESERRDPEVEWLLRQSPIKATVKPFNAFAASSNRGLSEFLKAYY